jgi:hypothetical protein
MEGGFGYTPTQVGNMTLDQIFFLLCDKKVLRGSERKRTASFDSSSVSGTLPVSADGMVAGRDRHGNPMRAKIGGMSKAARLAMEQAQQKERERLEAEKQQPKQKRRRT